MEVPGVRRFNGATAFQPWKSCPLGRRNDGWLIWLQWGHGISAVEVHDDFRALRIGGIASMGPRHFSRGSPQVWSSPRWIQRLQWGHGISAVEVTVIPTTSVSRACGFNGATAFQPWKSCLFRIQFERDRKLQWGHGISAVEVQLPMRVSQRT